MFSRTAEDLRLEMCRNIEAVRFGGFDGKQHPEHMRTVRVIEEVLYPVTLEQILKLAGRTE